MSSRTSDHVHLVQCKRWCDYLISFPICFFFHFLGGCICSCALLVLLFVIIIQLKKCFASISGRKGWSSCGQLGRAELGCLLPSPSVCAGAVCGPVIHNRDHAPWWGSVCPDTCWRHQLGVSICKAGGDAAHRVSRHVLQRWVRRWYRADKQVCEYTAYLCALVLTNK